MEPIYIPDLIELSMTDFLLWTDSLPWEDRTPARREIFGTPRAGVSYTYGTGRAERTYISTEMDPFTATVMEEVNGRLGEMGPMNGCFGNCYEDETKALGWHSDDFVGMDHTKAVCVVSFGSVRELHFRPKGHKGDAPLKLRLGHGSLVVMPPGYQHTHDHKVARADRPHTIPRVSLTFRAFLPSNDHV